MATAPNNELMEAFLVEAGELVDGLGDQLVALEAQPHDDELLNCVFRIFHTVKGGAGFLAVRPMVDLSHHAESLLDEARHHRIELQPAHIDCLLQVMDVLTAMMRTLQDTNEVAPASPELIDQLRQFLPANGAANPPASTVGVGAPLAPEQARTGEPQVTDSATTAAGGIDDGEFEALLDQIYGAGGAPGKNAIGPTASHAAVPPADVTTAMRTDPVPPVDTSTNAGNAPHDAATAAPARRTDSTVRVDTDRIDALINAAGELVLVRNRLSNLTAQGASSKMERAVTDLDRVTRELQTAALRMRMQPIGRLFQRFPRIVRDVARKLGKQVVLEQNGGDTNLDRTLVESLADPLIHLMRNAIDHGLEDPTSRTRAGKSAHGTVTLTAGQQGERILITVHDDGRGMDAKTLCKVAVDKGLITAEQGRALTPVECYALIFRPGFSTSDKVSDISGRGVGMDVVKTNVAALGGTVDIESTVGVGSTIRISIPLTLAIMPVLMVRVGKRPLALPLANVTEVFELSREAMRWLDGRVVAAHRGRPLPLSDLAAWTGAPATGEARVHVVVVQVGHQQLGLMVTEVFGREQVMIKPLGAHVRHLPGINGATITGDGRIALVMDLIALAEHPLPPVLQLVA